MTDDRWGRETADLLRSTTEQAIDFLGTLSDRPVWPDVTASELRELMGGPLPEDGIDDHRVISDLARAADRGLVSDPGPRYFGFVNGGAIPAALAADWLTSAWDQNANLYVMSPAAAVAETIVGEWLLELLDLPRDASIGMVTGAQMANFVGLAAARRAVLGRVGWDVERDGLQGSDVPRVRVLMGDEGHVTVTVALQMLGLGGATPERVAADDQGRMRPDVLSAALHAGDLAAPTIVCAQVGNVNTGASDDIAAIAPMVRQAPNSWVHVDGAFGLWARAVPGLRDQLNGVELADSWATDAHKWLNVPYDSGIAIVRDRDAHRGSMMMRASYLVEGQGEERDPSNYVPESSRRARGFTVYAAMRSLGRRGIEEMVARCCALAARMARTLADEPGVAILNDVTLNQVLVRFGDDDELTRDTIRRVQDDGTCWLGGTTWHGMAAMRISVSNWSTTEEDADASTEAILRCFRAAREAISVEAAAT